MIFARDKFFIDLDGNMGRGHFELLQQGTYVERLSEFLRLAIDENLHL